MTTAGGCIISVNPLDPGFTRELITPERWIGTGGLLFHVDPYVYDCLSLSGPYEEIYVT